MDQELLHAISQIMDEKLQPIKDDIEAIKADQTAMRQDIESIKEDVQITRAATDRLIDWAERSEKVTKVPLFRKQG
mgnify:CR=1 FL=1